MRAMTEVEGDNGDGVALDVEDNAVVTYPVSL
jgi:hypothetical protein